MRRGVFGTHNRIFQIVKIVKIKNDRYFWNGFFARNSMVQFLGPTFLTQKKARALLCGRILTFVHFKCILWVLIFLFVLLLFWLTRVLRTPTSAAQRLPQVRICREESGGKILTPFGSTQKKP